MNHLKETTRLAREQRFAYKIRQALNESADALPADKLEQLAAARKAALRAHVHQPVAERLIQPVLLNQGQHLATLSGGAHSPMYWGRMGLALSALLLVAAALISVFDTEQQQRIDELADVDTGVLSDELPISIYADHGFNAYLKQIQATTNAAVNP